MISNTHCGPSSKNDKLNGNQEEASTLLGSQYPGTHPAIHAKLSVRGHAYAVDEGLSLAPYFPFR